MGWWWWCGGGGVVAVVGGGDGLRLVYDLFLRWLYKSYCHFILLSDELS